MKNKKPTLKDVAKKAGVSVSTVSFVINNNSSISTAVRKKVQKIIEDIGYIPNSSAQNMRTGKSMTIGLILPDLANPFFPELAQAVENTAREHGYSTVLIDCDLNKSIEEESIDRLCKWGVDGIVWFPVSQEDTTSALQSSVPITVVDRQLKNYDTVVPNHFQGGVLQAEHLLNFGHERIGMISGPLSVDNMKDRRDSFIETVSGKAKMIWEIENPFSMTIDSKVKEKILEGGVTAIVAGNDIIAIGAMEILKQAGVKVPQDVSVIGFDNISWGQWMSPTLTTISLPVHELGSQAFNFLLRRINKPSSTRYNLCMDLDIIPRGSVTDLKNSTEFQKE